jgi:hypothetical protein
LTRFLHANRFPPRIKSGAGFRLKTLYSTLPIFFTAATSRALSSATNFANSGAS